MITADALRAALAKRSFRATTNEAELQAALASVFTEDGFAFEREVAVDAKNRFDFWFAGAGIALEVKIQGSTAALLTQLHRYAALECVREIVVVTTRMQHRVAAVIAGKPVTSIWIGGGL